MAGDLPPELLALIPQGVTQSGGYSGDPQDLPVFTGWEDRPTSGVWGTIRKETPGGVGRSMKKMPKPGSKLSSQMEKDFYAMDPEDRAILQKRLYAGGFYPNIDPESVTLGIPDEASFKAYSTAVGRAASYYASGKFKTLDDVLDEAAGIQAQIDAAGGGGRGGGSGSGRDRAPLTVALTNPDDLKKVAQKTATSTLGRALTDQEIERFVASFHGLQSGEQTTAYNADETGGTVTAAPQAGVAAETFARQADPTAAGGQDFFRTFSAFRRILGEA